MKYLLCLTVALTTIAVVLGMVLLAGSPVAQAQECERRLNKPELQVN